MFVFTEVCEHDNGTYTVIFIAIRTYFAKPEVELLYTDEIIAAIVRVRRLWVKQNSVNNSFHNSNIARSFPV